MSEVAEELDRLSAAATPGPWIAGDPYPFRPGAQVRLYGADWSPIRIEETRGKYVAPAADAQLIVALVNAYRAGQLSFNTTDPTSTGTKLLAEVKTWRGWYATGESPSPSEWAELDRIIARAEAPEGERCQFTADGGQWVQLPGHRGVGHIVGFGDKR